MLPIAARSMNLDEIEYFPEEEKPAPWLTWHMQMDGAHIQGFANELEALNETIYRILRTERGRYPIYGNDYGLQFADLVGEPKRYVFAVLSSRIPEALMRDDRILSVDTFSVNWLHSRGHNLSITYKVHSVLGTFTRMDDVYV